MEDEQVGDLSAQESRINESVIQIDFKSEESLKFIKPDSKKQTVIDIEQNSELFR